MSVASSSTLPPAPREILIPNGYTLHTESTTHILLKSNDAFLNPAQEFNRDLSVAVIKTWSEIFSDEKRQRWAGKRKRREEREERVGGRKKRRVDGAAASTEAHDEAEDIQEEEQKPEDDEMNAPQGTAAEETSPTYRPHKFTLLEAFSATGLRSIRYAKEIPLVQHVVANDISAAAIASMKQNVEINGLGPKEVAQDEVVQDGLDAEAEMWATAEAAEGEEVGMNGKEKERPRVDHNALHGTVRVSKADARAVMYAHSDTSKRFDAIDLDPYGTAAPFIDGAVQSITDGGLLCVTCTDMSVLASANYMEKCYANYGGVPVRAEYCHEAALRLVLHTISTSAARYGRVVTPLLSLSIDFYVRVFVRLHTSPLGVKRAASRTGIVYVCGGCQAWHVQPLGRYMDREGGKGPQWKLANGPPESVTGHQCDECGGKLQLAGPMWIGPLHERAFVERVLKHVKEDGKERYGTVGRMKGMLTVASEELDSPFYFTPSTVAGLFHCVCPSLLDTVSALLNAGHQVTRSHACPGSIKTSATRAEIYDLFRSWIKTHPVNMTKVSEHGPTKRLLGKEITKEADFTKHPDFQTRFTGIKLVRYSSEKWAPGTRSKG